jgi:hypothetical protein
MLLATGGIFAQSDSALTTAPFRDAVVYAGPGDTYQQLGWLNAGAEVTITERNRIGNWLHVVQEREDGTVLMDGWVLPGYFHLSPELRYSELPVSDLPDADPDYTAEPSVVRLYNVPVIPEISEAMAAVYSRGRLLRNHSNVVTKVGDSLSDDPFYLTPIRQTDYVLGPYDYLEETIQFFGPTTAESSIAARIGMNSLVVFDPMWAESELCQPSETPLACEYRVRHPSISVIMFGANDVMHMTDETFARQMRQIVDETLARGIIPVLSTFSYDPDADLWWQAVNFNLALVEIADEYQIPLINLWAAARALPDYGLDQDHVHLTHSGFRYLKYDSGHETWFGVSLYNLLTIRTLDEIRRTLAMG